MGVVFRSKLDRKHKKNPHQMIEKENYCRAVNLFILSSDRFRSGFFITVWVLVAYRLAFHYLLCMLDNLYRQYDVTTRLLADKNKEICRLEKIVWRRLGDISRIGDMMIKRLYTTI